MQAGNKNNTPKDLNNHSENGAKSIKNKKQISAAHREALHDIEQDADLSIHSPNDYLDEGETARLGEEKTDLI